MNMAQAEYMDKRKIAQILPATKRFEFFGSKHNSGMDHTSDINLVLANYLPKAIELPHEIIDVKTEENIWSFDRRTAGKMGDLVDYTESIEWLPAKMKKQLNEFKKK